MATRLAPIPSNEVSAGSDSSTVRSPIKDSINTTSKIHNRKRLLTGSFLEEVGAEEDRELFGNNEADRPDLSNELLNHSEKLDEGPCYIGNSERLQEKFCEDPSVSDFLKASEGTCIPLQGLGEWKIVLSRLYVGPRFATGAFGGIYRGEYDGLDVAVKILRQPVQEAEKASVAHQFQQEVLLMSRLCHNNIVKFVGAAEMPPVWCVVTEYMTGGSLRDFLQNHKQLGLLELTKVIEMALGIARGMAFLHSQSIVHRDLKSDNVLVAKDGSVKIADLGVSRMIGKPNEMTGESGTYRWMAPEMISRKPYTRSVDVYSFGLVLWELMTCDLPFEGMSAVQAAFAVVNKNARPPVPRRNSQLEVLMQQCWHSSPKKRPTFTRVVEVLEKLSASIRQEANRSSSKQRAHSFSLAKNLSFSTLPTSLRQSRGPLHRLFNRSKTVA